MPDRHALPHKTALLEMNVQVLVFGHLFDKDARVAGENQQSSCVPVENYYCLCQFNYYYRVA